MINTLHNSIKQDLDCFHSYSVSVFYCLLNIRSFVFFRNLQYVLLFRKVPPEQKCDFMLQQLLPADTYISTDQLNDLMRFEKVYYMKKLVLYIFL